MRFDAIRTGWCLARSAVPLALLGLVACAPRHAAFPATSPLAIEVRQILTAPRPTPEYYDARARLQQMGPEVDAVLVALLRDPRARPVARANALVLLADRESPATFAVLQRALLSEPVDMLRSAAVLALSRLPQEHASEAANLLRSALSDPARTVRLNALQSLDIRHVDAIRGLLEDETDREVRQVATQLVSLAESRGAPLEPDRRGALRTAGADHDPHIVFRPVQENPLTGTAVGDLRLELPNAPDLALAPQAEVVGRVVPAFFSPDRAAVVFEVEREIRLVHLESRRIVTVGPGVAPRLIPFSHQFVFVREVEGGRREVPGGTEILYEVFRGYFSGQPTERIGQLRAIAREELRGNYSPVRWMVVGEEPDGFTLRGEGVERFPLPSPVWRPGSPGSPNPDR